MRETQQTLAQVARGVTKCRVWVDSNLTFDTTAAEPGPRDVDIAALQDKIDDKRRFRPDENDLGIIDTYTKKSAQERLEYDRAQEEEKSRKKNEYQSIPGVEL